MSTAETGSLLKNIDKFGGYTRAKLNGIALNFLLLVFGPALILIGLQA